jgi:hypothetical protein
MWFADAAKSCGERLTRVCFERFVAREEPYTARGLLLPVTFRPSKEPPKTRRSCLSIARWSDDGRGGNGGWVTQGGDMFHNCFTVLPLPYKP